MCVLPETIEWIRMKLDKHIYFHPATKNIKFATLSPSSVDKPVRSYHVLSRVKAGSWSRNKFNPSQVRLERITTPQRPNRAHDAARPRKTLRLGELQQNSGPAHERDQLERVGEQLQHRE